MDDSSDFDVELKAHSPLGKTQGYQGCYEPALLCAVPRSLARAQLGLGTSLPFEGVDVWTAYELSWLDANGKPIVAMAELRIPCTSPQLIESKSLKLYLNSFNDSNFTSAYEVQEAIQRDLSHVADEAVEVQLFSPSQWNRLQRQIPQGFCLDGIEINCDAYQVDPSLLRNGQGTVEETVFTRLFRSNCLITGQPDWANIEISYQGPQIDHAQLLRYLVSYRQHRGFHEQCIESIYMDLLNQCNLQSLTVIGRFTRRGGLDINPYRSNTSPCPPLWRHMRQ